MLSASTQTATQDASVSLPSAVMEDSEAVNNNSKIEDRDRRDSHPLVAVQKGSMEQECLIAPGAAPIPGDQENYDFEHQVDPRDNVHDGSPLKERTCPIAVSENTFFADPTTGRVESSPPPVSTDDTLVSPVEIKGANDDSSSQTLTAKRNAGVVVGDARYMSMSHPLDHPPRSTEFRFHSLRSSATPVDDSLYVIKSSVANGSASPRRNSLGRLLNPGQSIRSRIYPYAPTENVHDDDDTPRIRKSLVDDAPSAQSAQLSIQTVQVAETNQTIPLKPSLTKPPLHTQRSIYARTVAMLSDNFENRTVSRNGSLVIRIVFVCIILNIAILALETCDGKNRGSSAPGYPYLPSESFYRGADALFTSIFTIEFIGRLIAYRRKRDVFKDSLTWIDVVSLSPWYLQLILRSAGQDFNLDASDGFAHKLGLLRLIRVFRLGYILRHYESMKVLVASLRASIPPLMVTMFFLATLVMLLATAIFYAEPCYNLYTCPFTDIFNSAYFIMVTVATVGYGNQVPSANNVLAMSIAFVAMVFGQLYLAMPLAIVGNNFQNVYETFQQSKRRKMKRQDTTLHSFDSVQLHRKSHRLCDIQFHILSAWRIIQLNIDKAIRKAGEVNEQGTGSAKDSSHAITSSQIHVIEGLVQAQLQRLAKIKEAIDKLVDIHTEACELLQPFIAHKRKAHAETVANSSASNSVLPMVLGRARKAIANAHFGLRDNHPNSRRRSDSHRGRLWLALEVPGSSRMATAINRIMMGLTLFSVTVFFSESMPELMDCGVYTSSCRRVVDSYCESKGFSLPDPGCFVRLQNTSADWTTPLDFGCKNLNDRPSCYGHGLNFGSRSEDALPCVEAFTETGVSLICFRMQCITSAAAIVNMEPHWIYIEWVLGLSFLSEILLRFYASNDHRHFFNDTYNVFDVLAVLPFAFELCDYVFFGTKPSYAVVATAPSFFSVIRVLKTMRILKLTRHFRGTKVLAQTAHDVWRQLLIPIFFLLTMCILAAAVFFEIERGTECFVGTPCYWWKKQLLTPQLTEGLPVGKRILIQDNNAAVITDMLKSTWLSAATFTTVGYGDVCPRTVIGRMFTICIAVIGTIYTSMPITLVGGKFRSLYAQHAEKVVVRRGGSSASWKSKPNVLSLSKKEDDEAMRKGTHTADSGKLPYMFKLSEDEIERLHQFKSLKRTLQNLQRYIDNLQEVYRDILIGISPKRLSVAQVETGAPVSVSSNVLRKSAVLEHALADKSNAILDAILQFSSLVEKLQDAPPFYEAFVPETPASLHQSGGVEQLLPPELRNRLLQTRS